MSEFPNPLEIRLGKGNVLINTFEDGRERGLIFIDTKEEHVVGDFDFDHEDGELRLPKENEVFVTCGNIESARVLQSFVNKLVLEFEGYSVDMPNPAPGGKENG